MKAKLELLKKVNIFSTLDETGPDVIAQNSSFCKYTKNSIIFREGEYAGQLYIISKGEISIQKEKDGQKINIADFISGESFGELDMLENKPMTATAIADSDTELLEFPSKDKHFQTVLKEHPEISARILHELLSVIAGRIRNTNKLLSEKSKWLQDLKGLLYNDKLTGLLNKTYLAEEFQPLLDSQNGTLSVIMIKPDNFKIINDNYGHDGGDKALKEIAHLIKTHSGKNSVTARYRGDEFAVIIPETDRASTQKLSEELRYLISKVDLSNITGNNKIILTASIGVSMFPENSKKADTLIKLSFEKMFEARESGGNRILFA